MADEFDRAAAYEEQDRQAAIARRKEEGPGLTGYCLHCEDPLAGRRWCDAHCRDAWEQEQKRIA